MRNQRQFMLQLQIVQVAKVFAEMLGKPDAIAYLERNGFSPDTAQALLAGGPQDAHGNDKDSGGRPRICADSTMGPWH